MSDFLIFNNIDSRDYGLYIVNNGNNPQVVNVAPPMINRTRRIAGRDSSYIFEQNYGTRTITVSLYSNRKDLEIEKLVSRWLGKKGVKTLVLSYEPYRYYNAVIEHQISMDGYSQNQGMMELTFTCYDPLGYSGLSTLDMLDIEYNDFNYYNSGLIFVDLNTNEYVFNSGDLPNLDVFHGGTADSATPEITIVGSGTDITIEHYRDSARTDLVTSCEFGAFSGTLIIDSLKQDIFLNGSLSSLDSGDYFKLFGIFDLTPIFMGEIQNVNGTQITLNSEASAVDDIYNGSVFSVGNINKLEHRNIVDYDGTTKIATIDVPLDEFNGNTNVKRFSIYDLSDGVNYFKITGTGLSITSISFDFKFVFL